MQNRLYVGNLAADVSVGELQELFEPHGFVVDVKLMPVENKVDAARVAFVILATDESAQVAVKALNGSSLRGTAIQVEVARDHHRDPASSAKGMV